MISEKLLNKWIKKLIPEKYGPDSDPQTGKPILGVYLETTEKLSRYSHKDQGDLTVCGLAVDMGKQFRLVGIEKLYLDNKFIIYINSDLPEKVAVYSLAHELGHVHGSCFDNKEHDKNPDRYADRFANKLIEERIESSEVRTEIILAGLKSMP